ncbi:MAG TPA: ABC transporter ATP-binding protein [Candidatus Limnocylindrales bacterium]
MSVVGAAAARADGPAIEVTGLAKRYGARTVLDGVDLRVAPGEIVALLGPNGAGKTTLVEIVEGYRTADAGRAVVLGSDAATGGPALKARIGLMLQSGGLDPRSTPTDVLRLYAAFFERRRSPESILRVVGLEAVARTRIRQLSGGERQRLALGLALIGEPDVLLLDEPTAGMDPEARQATRALIAGLRDEGSAILLTTHDLGDVERLADRVAILHGGRIRAEGSPGELMAGAAEELRFRLHAPAATPALAAIAARLGPAAKVQVDSGAGGGRLGPSYQVTGAGASADAIAEIATWAAREGLLIVELRAGAASLEDRYLELTGDRDVEPAA